MASPRLLNVMVMLDWNALQAMSGAVCPRTLPQILAGACSTL